MTICNGLFHIKTNRRIALIRFRNRLQLQDENVDAFLTELRLLAHDCNFDNATEQWELADTLVMNCRDKDLQRKLLSDHPDDAGVDVILTAM